jgi:polyisoprenoid-binding protein YceI
VIVVARTLDTCSRDGMRRMHIVKRFHKAGAFLGIVFAVAGCGRGPEGNSAPAGDDPANRGTARPPGSSRDAATASAVPTGPDTQSVPAVPQSSKWALDPENSSVGFLCKHVLTNVRGMFPKPSGTVTLDEATPSNSKVAVTVDVSSITTGVEERDTHLKGPDFFDAAKYPVITFVSTSFTKSSATSYSVTGNLTMHGVTKPVTLAVTAPPPFNHAGGTRRGIEATTSVNRKDFGLRWEFPGEGAGVVVGDNIDITIDAELVLQPEPSKGG